MGEFAVKLKEGRQLEENQTDLKETVQECINKFRLA
jgi:hypothetical protein